MEYKSLEYLGYNRAAVSRTGKVVDVHSHLEHTGIYVKDDLLMVTLRKYHSERGYVQARVPVGYLVAMTFIEQNKSTDVVEYIDGNRQNCDVSNLRWVKPGRPPAQTVPRPPPGGIDMKRFGFPEYVIYKEARIWSRKKGTFISNVSGGRLGYVAFSVNGKVSRLTLASLMARAFIRPVMANERACVIDSSLPPTPDNIKILSSVEAYHLSRKPRTKG